jgi:predicted phage terminase large subunit-like protein
VLTEIEADREYCRASFRYFVERAWPVIEPNPFVPGWHIDALCAHLEAVSAGQISNLAVCVPPGTSKSLITSTLWPAWQWIKDPTERFLAATYGQDLSNKNAKLHRDLVASSWYRERWPHVQIADVTQVQHFETTARGWRIATSVGGRATGIHATVHIGDDLAKAQDASGRNYVDPLAIHAANSFWFETMLTRRADARTLRRVLIGQRLHHEDTPGLAIARGYTALVLPMEYDPRRRCKTSVYWVDPDRTPIARRRFADPREDPARDPLLVPSRFPREVVDQDRVMLGPIAHEAQNQQNPTPSEGAIFKDAGRNRWKVVPTVNARKIITIDCSFKDKKTSDFVSMQVWVHAGTNFYLVDRRCARMGITDTIRNALELRALHPGAAIYVEDKANGPAVVEMLQGEIPGVIAWDPGQDSKESRARAVAHLFDANNVWLPPDDVAPWIAEYLTTLGRFPLVRHDDDVDATTMALRILHVPYTRSYAAAVANMTAGYRGMLPR